MSSFKLFYLSSISFIFSCKSLYKSLLYLRSFSSAATFRSNVLMVILFTCRMYLISLSFFCSSSTSCLWSFWFCSIVSFFCLSWYFFWSYLHCSNSLWVSCSSYWFFWSSIWFCSRDLMLSARAYWLYNNVFLFSSKLFLYSLSVLLLKS